ncbi:MAG: nicotinamide-nucleotide adenylyltransferase [Promethearchaeota archaeon]
MEDELLTCIKYEDIKYLESGQISKYVFPVPRKKAHQERISHLIVRFFVITVTPQEEILYLVQKRGKQKKGHPEYFTDSASGHVVYEDDMDLDKIKLNAIRELEEEFGIPEEKIKKVIFRGLEIEKNSFSGEIAYIFYGLVDNDVKLNPNPDELEINGSKFYNKKELKTLFEKEKVVDYSRIIWQSILNTDFLSLFDEKEFISKKEKIALFIGRFQPLHKGHLFVIKEILKRVKQLKIGIGSAQISHTLNDPFTAEERKQFLVRTLNRLGYKGRYRIYQIPDIFNAKKWVDYVISVVGHVDIIYSNNEWVRELFLNKGYKISNKIILEMKKYNGSIIRNSILEDTDNWKKLVPKEVENIIKDINGIERLKKLKN